MTDIVNPAINRPTTLVLTDVSSSPTGIPARVLGFLRDVVRSFAAQWIFFILPLLYLATNAWFMRGLHNPQTVPLSEILVSMLTITLPCAIFGLFILRLAQLLLIKKPQSPISTLFADIRHFASSPQRIANGLPLVVAVVLFNKALLDFKPNIPLIKPFLWDESLMKLDRLLHFGVDPWRLLQPILGHEWVTYILNLDYNFWFLALFGLWFWFAFRPDFTALRTRFFLSYMITWWLGGGLLAYFFSSAGPCYYALIGVPEDPFAPQLAYLADINAHLPLGALDAQQASVGGLYRQGSARHGHLRLSFHAQCDGNDLRAGRVPAASLAWHRFAINMAVILFGSVHLAWHYAVDAYAGILMALVGWWIDGPVAQWYPPLRRAAPGRKDWRVRAESLHSCRHFPAIQCGQSLGMGEFRTRMLWGRRGAIIASISCAVWHWRRSSSITCRAMSMRSLTHRNFGFSDAAEIFVLLAGFASAYAYFARYERGDDVDASLKALKRSGVLYVSHVVTTVAAIALFCFAAVVFAHPGYLDDSIVYVNIKSLFDDPVTAFPGLVGLGHQLGYFNILPMYMVILAMLPVMMWLARARLSLLLGVSIAVYLVGRLVRHRHAEFSAKRGAGSSIPSPGNFSS